MTLDPLHHQLAGMLWRYAKRDDIGQEARLYDTNLVVNGCRVWLQTPDHTNRPETAEAEILHAKKTIDRAMRLMLGEMYMRCTTPTNAHKETP